jgi:hypothetical protein
LAYLLLKNQQAIQQKLLTPVLLLIEIVIVTIQSLILHQVILDLQHLCNYIY